MYVGVSDLKLTLEQIKTVTDGVEDVIFEDNKFKFLRFTKDEINAIENPNLHNPAGVRMEFKTDGDKLKLKVSTKDYSTVRSYFSFDIFRDGELMGCLKNFDDKECIEDYAVKKYPLGISSEEFSLGNGEKCIKILFPHSVSAEIEDIEISNATYIAPIEKKSKTLLVYGDSITQGYDSPHPSLTYAYKLSEYLDARLVNKALGGACFCPDFVAANEEMDADWIICSYGSNDWRMLAHDEIIKNAQNFMDIITKKYPKTPIFVLTPIWRADYDSEENKQFGDFFNIERIIKDAVKPYKNITLISGWDLVPHDKNLYGDLYLHPNIKGFEYFVKNLAEKIK